MGIDLDFNSSHEANNGKKLILVIADISSNTRPSARPGSLSTLMLVEGSRTKGWPALTMRIVPPVPKPDTSNDPLISAEGSNSYLAVGCRKQTDRRFV